MTLDQVIDALRPFFSLLGKEPTSEQWHQYGLSLQDVNPGDLDDAIADLRKTHAFRTLPLPVEILGRAEIHRKRRQQPKVDTWAPITTSEGTLREFTLAGIGTLKLRVLPDDHPALRRYACFTCKDTGWAEAGLTPMGNDAFRRCNCVASNPVIQRERDRRATKTSAA